MVESREYILLLTRHHGMVLKPGRVLPSKPRKTSEMLGDERCVLCLSGSSWCGKSRRWEGRMLQGEKTIWNQLCEELGTFTFLIWKIFFFKVDNYHLQIEYFNQRRVIWDAQKDRLGGKQSWCTITSITLLNVRNPFSVGCYLFFINSTG